MEQQEATPVRRGVLQPISLPLGLLVASALGLAIRLYVVLSYRPTCEPYDVKVEGCRAVAGDSLYFFEQGRRLAQGDWYVDPLVTDANTPGAGDPPVFATFLGLLSRLGIDTAHGQRIATCVVGAVGVLLIGLVASRLAGPRGAVVAGVLAATYPMLWINDGQLMSESVYVPFIAVVLLLLLRLWEQPSVGRALAAGAMLGLAGLTRAEALMFFPFVVLPLALGLRQLPVLRRLALVGVAGAAGAVVLAPWVVFNMARFEQPTTMSSQSGSVLLSSACDAAYHGELVGYYSFDCFITSVSERHPTPQDGDKSTADIELQRLGREYIQDNLDDLPRVAAFRVGRVWQVYRPGQSVELEDLSENRGRTPSQLGLYMYAGLVPFAIAGLVIQRRRRLPISIYLGMAFTATVVAAATFGVTRYRVPTDVCLVVLAAVAVDAAWRWFRSRPPRSVAGADGDDPSPNATAPPDEAAGATTTSGDEEPVPVG